MEDLLIKVFGDYAILFIPIVSGIACSFVIEALNQTTPPKISGKGLFAIVSLAIGVLLLFVFPSLTSGWAEKVFLVIMNSTVALVFYHIGGKILVERLIGGAIKLIGKKVD